MESTGNSEFLQELSGAEIENSASVIFALNERLNLVYCNAAWDRFARANGGEALLRPALLGRCVLEFIPEPLTDFYAAAYRTSLETKSPWRHEYECSSPSQYRKFVLEAFPLRRVAALLVVNSLIDERQHATGYPGLEKAYGGEGGQVVMCSHCRRTRRHGSKPEQWDWVPDFVATPPRLVSHGLCPICLEYYYPD